MLLKLHQETSRFSSPRARYLLIAGEHPGCDLALQVIDCDRECVLLDWQGAVVRHLFESGIVPKEYCRPGRYPCDKSFVWHLLLAGAAAQTALDQMGCTKGGCNRAQTRQRPVPGRARHLPPLESLANRLASLGVQLAGPHKWIAQVLFAYPDEHFTAEDVRCLLQLEYPLLIDDDVSARLDGLVCSGVIQRIEVDGENVFYDIDTSPHLHLFDTQTRQLSNANSHGIVHVG